MLNKWRSLQQRSQGPIFPVSPFTLFQPRCYLVNWLHSIYGDCGLLAARYCLSPPPAAPRVPRCSHLIAGPRGAGLQVTHFYTHTSSINTEEKLSYPHLLIVWTIVHSNVPFQKHISVNLHFSKLQWTFTMKGNKLPSSALVDVTKNNRI